MFVIVHCFLKCSSLDLLSKSSSWNVHNDHMSAFKSSIPFVTASILKESGKYCFPGVCLFTFRGGTPIRLTGGYPHPVKGGEGVPHLADMGRGHTHLADGGVPASSAWQSKYPHPADLRGIPIQLTEGTPIQLTWGVPLLLDWMGYNPPCQDWNGVTPHEDWMGVPPPPHQDWMGVPHPLGDRPAEWALATGRAVCLLRTRRRTFLWFDL